MVYSLTLEDKSTFDEIIIQRGVETYNQSHGFDPVVELAAFVRDDKGKVQGGVYGELVWNWLYIDLLWVSDSLRGQDCGARLMASIEQEALRRGVEYIYLATTSFQALPFYYHIGYRLFGKLENRPPGYNYYYLHKMVLPMTIDDPYPVTDDPDPEDFKVIRQGLSAYNYSQGVNPDGRRLAVYVRDEENNIYGGIIAATYWSWLDIQMFWVNETLRGQGWGKKLLESAEQEAMRRKCYNAFTDVASFQGVGFFQKQGYTEFGRLQDRPPGYMTHFMQKALLPSI